jgi:aryl-alcohol dehydrogenase-like predicted oxidoreductase
MAVTATASGTFAIGGDMQVTRLGFGAMRITGAGIWGPPNDPVAARAVLRRLRSLEVDFIDTADSYGPYVSEDLVCEVLHPYGPIKVATKAGLTRSGPSRWSPVGRPEYLRQCCEMSLRRLGVETLDLWQLHRIDAKVPREEQFGVMRDLQEEGKVRHLGLSEVDIEEIEAAGEYFEVATVQNLFNLTERRSEDVLEHCEQHGIGFIPWFPLAAGDLAEPGGPVADIARERGATAGQVALAWLLARSPVMLPIPGTGSLEHLEENVAAAGLELADDELALLDQAA